MEEAKGGGRPTKESKRKYKAYKRRVSRLTRNKNRPFLYQDRKEKNPTKIDKKKDEDVEMKDIAEEEDEPRGRSGKLTEMHLVENTSENSLPKFEKLWLRTHIWHAKRFYMYNLWNWRIPFTPTNKGERYQRRISI